MINGLGRSVSSKESLELLIARRCGAEKRLADGLEQIELFGETLSGPRGHFGQLW